MQGGGWGTGPFSPKQPALAAGPALAGSWDVSGWEVVNVWSCYPCRVRRYSAGPHCIRRTGDSTRDRDAATYIVVKSKNVLCNCSSGSLRPPCSMAGASIWLVLAVLSCCAWQRLNRAAIGCLFEETRWGSKWSAGQRRNWSTTPACFDSAGTQQPPRAPRSPLIGQKTTLDPCKPVARRVAAC